MPTPDATALLDAWRDAALLVDAGGRVLHANAAARRLWPGGVAVGQALASLVATDAPALHALLRQGARSRQPSPGRLLLRRGDAAVVPQHVEVSAVQPRRGEAPAVLLLRLLAPAESGARFTALNERIAALSREVARRRAAEAQLAEQREWLRVVLRSIGDAVIATDEAGRVVFMNPTAEALTGWPQGDASGRPLADVLVIVDESSRQPVPSPVDIVLRERRVVGLANHTLLIARDGVEFPIDDAAAPIVDDAGALRGVVLVFREIGERVRAERQRRELERQLRDAQKMEAIGTLAGGIAHDFNNVLGSILGNAALARDELDAHHPAQRRLAQITRAGQRARDLVRQILAFGRRQPQQLRRQDLRPLVDETLALLRGTLPSVVQLDVQLCAEPAYALVDATQVTQVILNLCTNAWHALHGSSGRIGVSLALHELDDLPGRASGFGPWVPGRYACIAVDDDGCGMAPEVLERIFEPFFTTKGAVHGTGLGLSVAHGIVAEHRGAIVVRSREGAGSRFELYLPLADAPDTEPAPLDVPAAPPVRGAGRRVAYVDDDEIMVATVEALLQRAGFAVEGFVDARAALRAIAQRPGAFDAVVSDFNMPGLTGLELAREVHRVHPALPVIVSSGYLSEDLRSGAAEAGVARLLNKEDTFERIAALVDEVLAERR